MHIDVDTFLTTLYCVTDDLYREHFAPHKPVRRGAKPRLSDSEVLVLAQLGQWDLHRSERWIRDYAAHHWRGYFPQLLGQSALNVRGRDLAGVLCRLGPLISRRLAEELRLPPPGGRPEGAVDPPDPAAPPGDGGRVPPPPAYETVDGVPVPLARRCRGRRHRLFADEAAIGRGGADKAFYYGVKVLAAVNPAGLITGFVVGPANTEEHFLAEALFRARQDPTAPAPTAADVAPALGPSHRTRGPRRGPTGPVARLGAGAPNREPYVSDLGLRGAAWQAHWRRTYGATVLTKDAYAAWPPADRRKAERWLAGIRQQVETTFSWLDGDFGLKFPRARTWAGLLARLGAKVAAFNFALYINYRFDRPTYSLFDPIRG
jgi:hypothetical protein